jgi:hypothetical protein
VIDRTARAGVAGTCPRSSASISAGVFFLGFDYWSRRLFMEVFVAQIAAPDEKQSY